MGRYANELRPPANGHAEVLAAFGDPTNFVRPDGTPAPEWEAEKIVRILLPGPIPFADGSPETGPWVTRLAVHRCAAEAFEAVFARLWRDGKWKLLKSCGGAYTFRQKKGSHRLSLHAWGLAVDLNVETNPMGKKGDMPQELIKTFAEYGFSWGGRWPGPSRDPMHFQYCNGY